jgi:hypothetical protein
MSASLRVVSDLAFAIEVPARSGSSARCAGSVRADGHEITVEFRPMPSLGGSSTRPLVRPLANQLDRLGLTLTVAGPDGPLVRLGAGVRSPWWQVVATHGARIELVSLRALARSVGGPKVFAVALPPAAVLPAVTRSQRAARRRVAVAARQLLRRVTGSRRT